MFCLATYLLQVLNNVMELKVMTMTMTSTVAGNWRRLDILLFSDAALLLKTVRGESQNDSLS